MHEVVPSAVRNAVSAATITFTASSTILCFFMIRSFFKFALVEGGVRREICLSRDILPLEYPLPLLSQEGLGVV